MALIHSLIEKSDVYTLTVQQDTSYILNKICGTKVVKVSEGLLVATESEIISFSEDGKYNLILSAVGEVNITIDITIYVNLLKSLLIDIETFLDKSCTNYKNCSTSCISKEAERALQYKNLYVKLMSFQSIYFDAIVPDLSLAYNTFISDSIAADRCRFQSNVNKLLKDECLHGKNAVINTELFTEFVALSYYAIYFIEKNLAGNDLEELAYLEEKFNTRIIIESITQETCLAENQVEDLFNNALNAVNSKPTIDNVELIPPNNLPNNLYSHNFVLLNFTTNFQDVQGDSPKFIKFNVLPVRGVLTYDNNPVTINTEYLLSNVGLFNYTATINEQRNIFDIILFQVSDDNILKQYSDMAQIIINTAGYINQPISQLGDLTLNKNNRENHVFTINDFTTSLNPPYVDPEGDSLDAIRVDSLPTAGQLQLNGSPVVAGDIIPATAINAGQFVFIAPDSDSSQTNNATFSARDSGSLQWVSA